MTGLSDALAESRTVELHRAARALLRRPVLRGRGPDGEQFVLVRRHAAELREWFDRNTGWRLLVDSEVARLVKTVATTGDPTHPARDPRTKIPFTRSRYVLACLALAALERADAQITLGRLAEQIVLGAADPALAEAGLAFTLERREERADLVAVVRLLLELGVFARVAGDEETFVRDSGDALYDVDRRVLAALLATPRGPSTVDAAGFEERLSALAEELPATTDELRNQQIRRRLTRLLLDDPVLYYDDLDDSELTYLTSQRGAITSRISELTGLVAEVRAEGIAMVDPLDDLTDTRMPEQGTEGHATLLVAEYLATHADRAVPITELHAHVAAMAQRHRSYWRRNAGDPGAQLELTEQALHRLAALRLTSRQDDQISARAALARYAVSEPTIQEPRG
ncbi:MAG: TIGR02678 family protein [Pseudonocardia sp.]